MPRRPTPSPGPTRKGRAQAQRGRRTAASGARARGAKSASSAPAATQSNIGSTISSSRLSSGGSPASRPTGSTGSGGGGGGGRPAGSPTSDPLDSICPICHSQITNLCITNCNHRFCHDCITQWTSRNGTCPSCRQNIHTIRHILPDGATDIIQISRAELLAHKVNEIYSILILLFTVMSHSLLPEVANYLEQLNEIARELNVPTTSSRMHRAAAEVERAAAEAPSSGSTSSAASSTTRASSAASSTAPSSPMTSSLSASSILFGRPSRPRGYSQEIHDDSDDEASMRPNDRVNNAASMAGLMLSFGSQGARMRESTTSAGASGGQGAQVAAKAAQATGSAPSAPPATGASAAASVSETQPATKATVASQPAGRSDSQATTAKQASEPQQQQASVKTLSSSAGLNAPPATVGSVSNRRPAAASGQQLGTRAPIVGYRIRIGASEDSGYSTPPPSLNARIRHTYQTANQRQAAQATSASVASSAAASITSPSRATMLESSLNSQTRPPTPEESRRTQEQRQRDIRFLTESYNKINQVYEVLMIMHMVIHRNQVDLEPTSSD